jgi:hypothetical protein
VRTHPPHLGQSSVWLARHHRERRLRTWAWHSLALRPPLAAGALRGVWVVCGGVDAAEIVRTRDPDQLKAMDIVVDVGGVYDPATCVPTPSHTQTDTGTGTHTRAARGTSDG